VQQKVAYVWFSKLASIDHPFVRLWRSSLRPDHGSRGASRAGAVKAGRKATAVGGAGSGLDGAEHGAML
jgi:hypothetical protein